MEITDVRIFKAKKRGPVLAYANVILDSRFIIRGSYRDVCHPLNANVRNELTETIFAAYDEFIENSENEE